MQLFSNPAIEVDIVCGVNRPNAAVLIAALCVLGCQDAKKSDAVQVGELVRNNDLKGLTLLLDNDDKNLKCAAAKALSWMKTPQAISVQTRVMAMPICGWRVSTEAMWRIAEMQRPNVLETLKPALSDRRPEVRWNAAAAVLKNSDASGAAMLEQCINDTNKFVAAWCRYGRCKLLAQSNCDKPNMNLTNGRPAP